MSITLFQILSLIAAASTGLLAGLYFVFHNTIMIVLAEQGGSIVMIRINQVILNKTFLMIFLLSPLSSLLALIIGLSHNLLNIYSPFLLGTILAIVSWVITIKFNVPLNNRLDKAVVDETAWQDYLVKWVNWNTNRYYLSTTSFIAIVSQFVFV